MFIKYIALAFLLFPVLAECGEYNPKEILSETIEARTVAARLKEISEVKLEDINALSRQNHCDYYGWVRTFKVLKVYKGKLDEYVLVKGFSEICNKKHLKLHGERYSLSGQSVVIAALCKNDDNTYSFGSFETFQDSVEMRKVAEESAKKLTKNNYNSCTIN